jgi:hypothetical protein
MFTLSNCTFRNLIEQHSNETWSFFCQNFSSCISHRIRMHGQAIPARDRCVVHLCISDSSYLICEGRGTLWRVICSLYFSNLFLIPTELVVLFVCYSTFKERPRPPIFVDDVPFPFYGRQLQCHTLPFFRLFLCVWQ